jgi:hypothetical protein
MSTSITLDWLAFTFREDTHEAAGWIRLYANAQGSMAIAPTNGYREAYRTTQGVVVMWNLDRAEMGYHVIISGSALRHVLEHYELDQQAIVQTVLHAGASITRLDLAKDVIGTKISLDSIYESLERGESTGTARSFSQIHSINGGNTIYVGSRQSEKFIRIYDKAAQTGDTSVHWYRFELETKGMVARALCTLLASDAQWVNGFDHIVRGMVHLATNISYALFFQLGTVPVGIPKLEKKTDREAWIEKQVIPAVAKHFVEFPDSAAVARLRALLDILDKQGN